MVHYCCAYGCKSRQSKNCGISFHSFPKDPDLRVKWTVPTKREGFVPTAASKLCSKHFTEDAYQLRPSASHPLLKPDAIPSVFNFPPHLVTPPPKKRRIIKKHIRSFVKAKALEDPSSKPKDIIGQVDGDKLKAETLRRVIYRSRKKVFQTGATAETSGLTGAEEDQPSACASDLPPSTDFCEVLVKTEPEEYSLAPGEPSTSGLTTEFDVVTCKNEIDECMTPEYEDPLADVVPEPEPEPVPVNDQLAADDLSYFQSLASNLNKLSLDQKMVFRIKVSNILRELVAA